MGEPMGSFGTDDGESNGNDNQNNFASASRLFVHFLAVTVRLRRKTS